MPAPADAVAGILLAEDHDIQHVLLHLCQHHDVAENFGIRPRQGIDDLLNVFPTFSLASQHAAVGVALDANASLAGRWRSIRDRLAERGYEGVPDAPDPEGTIVPAADGRPRFGAWIMPDNESAGMAEDFLRGLVPRGDDLLGRAGEIVAGLPRPRRFADVREPKAVMRTWLAWQEEPGKPFGTAIAARYLDAHAAPAMALVNWMRRLFAPDDQPRGATDMDPASSEG